MKYTIAHDTRVGKRPYNQDRLGYWRTPEALLLVLADGMGGHAHGEVAAELTMRHIAAAFRRDAKPRLVNPDLFLFRAVGRSHGMLLREARQLGLADTPRTTVVRGVSAKPSCIASRNSMPCERPTARNRNRSGLASRGFASRLKAAAMCRIVSSAATSPWACPPMPSATTSSTASGVRQYPRRSWL